MNRTALTALACLFTVAAPSAPASAAPTVSRFAIVVGNNRPDDVERLHLRYADDDAVAIARLLRQAGVQVTLLARLDRDTTALNPQFRPEGAPTWRELSAAVRATDELMRTASQRGASTEFYFVYSGHGGVARAEGYVVLEDTRLTRTKLFEGILARSSADRNHVVVDACKSFYLAFEKGPGGQRERFAGSFVSSSAWRELENTGFILSTSSDRDSHEWDRYQAGVFSHEVRSGLRGGADVDLDGAVSYGELGAFLATANRAIENPRFRPDFVVRPPGNARGALGAPVLSWPNAEAALHVDTAALGHFFVENTRGERIADIHVAVGQALTLYLPRERPLFVLPDGSDDEHELGVSSIAKLSELRATPLRIAERGAIHLAFAKLFTIPFSARQVRAFERAFTRPRLEPDLRVAERPTPQSTRRHRARSALGWTALATASVTVAASAWAYGLRQSGLDASHEERADRNHDIGKLTTVALISGTLALLSGGGWLTLSVIERPTTTPARPGLRPLATARGLVLSLDGQW